MHSEAISQSARKALGLISDAKLNKGFYLVGGTAAAIQIGHRVSVDLDFFTEESFEPMELKQKFDNARIELQNEQISEGTLIANLQGCKISFFDYPYPLIEPVVQYDSVGLASLMDIGLMKIIAISQRGSIKDFVDLYFIKKQIPLKDLFAKLEVKYKFGKDSYYSLLKSLTYFEDADQDPEPQMLVEWSWEDVKDDFKREMQLLKSFL